MTVRLSSHAKDEPGDMSDNFNQFANKLLEITNTIKKSAATTGDIKNSLEQNTNYTAEELSNEVNKFKTN